MLNYGGGGYTGEYIGSMSLDTMQWHVHKRHEDLMEQKRLHDEAVKKANKAGRSRKR